MDKATEMLLKSISEKIDGVRESHKEELHQSMKAVRHYVDANGEVTKIELGKIIERLDKSNGTLQTLKRETSWWRFFQRNPKTTIIFFTIFILGMSLLIGIDIESESVTEFIKHLKFW